MSGGQGILLQEDDVKFASLMVQMLNMILLTSPELFDLRQQLKKMETEESRSFFCTLFKSWCHSPMSTYALCLLAQQYEHACQLLLKFSDLPMTVSILVSFFDTLFRVVGGAFQNLESTPI